MCVKETYTFKLQQHAAARIAGVSLNCMDFEVRDDALWWSGHT